MKALMYKARRYRGGDDLWICSPLSMHDIFTSDRRMVFGNEKAWSYIILARR